MSELVWLALAGGLGGIARHALSGLVGRRVGETFPWGTLAVNVSGCLAAGVAAAAAGSEIAGVLLAGFLGSYTTVSSFSLQTLALLRDGEPARALANAALSLGLGLPAAALGLWAGARLIGGG